jgi:fumarate reductase subunit D
MEPQEQRIYCYCNKDKDCKKKSCLGIAVAIFLIALVATLGLIIGAAISEAILGALAALIVLAVVLFILFVVTLIIKYCNKRRC